MTGECSSVSLFLLDTSPSFNPLGIASTMHSFKIAAALIEDLNFSVLNDR